MGRRTILIARRSTTSWPSFVGCHRPTETLTLRFVEGMTGPEIAMRTGLTDGSVRVNLHRGMQQLKEQLGLLAGPQRSKGASDV
jgi:hypothetical protein